jgi:hypothetical protein
VLVGAGQHRVVLQKRRRGIFASFGLHRKSQVFRVAEVTGIS